MCKMSNKCFKKLLTRTYICNKLKSRKEKMVMESITPKKLIIIFYLMVIIFTCIFALRIENLESKEDTINKIVNLQ